MAGYLTTDVVNAIARKDETGQAVRARIGERSAVAQLANQIDMSTRSIGIVDVARPTAHFIDHGDSRAAETVSASALDMTAKPLTAILIFEKYMERDIASFAAEFTKKLGEAFAEAMDREVIRNADNKFSKGVLSAATAASQVVVDSGDLYDDLNTTLGFIEGAGYYPSGIIGRRAELATVRGAVDTQGRPLFSLSARDGAPSMLMGHDFYTGAGRSMPKTASVSEVRFVAADWSYVHWGLYESIKIDTHTSGTVVVGGTTYNLIQQGLVAVVAEQRAAFMVQDNAACAALVEAAS